MTPPVDERGVPIVLPHAESPSSRKRTRNLRYGSSDDSYDSSKDEVRLCRMRPDRHSLLEAYDNSSPQRPFAQSYYQQLTRLFNPLLARRNSKEEASEKTGQKRTRATADESENARPPKQRKARTTGTSVTSIEYTVNDEKKCVQVDNEEDKHTAGTADIKIDDTISFAYKDNTIKKKTGTRRLRSTVAEKKKSETSEKREMDNANIDGSSAANKMETIKPSRNESNLINEPKMDRSKPEQGYTMNDVKEDNAKIDGIKIAHKSKSRSNRRSRTVKELKTGKSVIDDSNTADGKIVDSSKIDGSNTAKDTKENKSNADNTNAANVDKANTSKADGRNTENDMKTDKSKMDDANTANEEKAGTTKVDVSNTANDIKMNKSKTDDTNTANEEKAGTAKTDGSNTAHNTKRDKLQIDDSNAANDANANKSKSDESNAVNDVTTDKSKADGSNAAKDTLEQKKAKLQEEIQYINSKVKHLEGNYKIIDKLGEGTFSTVYKAEDLRYDEFDNAVWKQQLFASWERTASAFGPTDDKPEIATKYVALKRIYCTSSPARIAHEISLLKSMSGCPCVAPLITAFREGDEFFIVMPYIEHDDFRRLFVDMTMDDIKCYTYSLLTGLKHLHSRQFIHRDIKPHNFLYNRQLRTGILIDFGLAESINKRLSKEEYDQRRSTLRRRVGRKMKENIVAPGSNAVMRKAPGYLRNDTRPSAHANRAGTRGFRAPEVLFREFYQTGAIDIWSVGVILLSLLSGQFPFFESKDDADALVEIATLLGLNEMKAFADKLNRTFDTNIKTIPRQAKSLYSICQSFNEERFKCWEENDIKNAIDLLQKCLTLDCDKRITAEDALGHPFFDIFANN